MKEEEDTAQEEAEETKIKMGKGEDWKIPEDKEKKSKVEYDGDKQEIKKSQKSCPIFTKTKKEKSYRHTEELKRDRVRKIKRKEQENLSNRGKRNFRHPQ